MTPVDETGFKAHRYTGQALDVTFFKERCTHVAACLRGEPKVFFELRRPWVLPDLGLPDKISKVVESCPTGALHYFRKDGGSGETAPATATIQAAMYGPFYFRGDITLHRPDGSVWLQDTRVALCRCGKSKTFPLCDGSHHRAGFSDRGKVYGDWPTDDPGQGPLAVRFQPNRPFRIDGPHRLNDDSGITRKTGNHCLLCSCGRSKNRPFCDGSHAQKGGFWASLWRRVKKK